MTAKSQAFKAKSVENKSNEQHGEKSWGQQGFISIHEKQQFQPAGLCSKELALILINKKNGNVSAGVDQSLVDYNTNT